MSDEKKVREAWDAFVAAAKEAKNLVVCPGASINAPVRVSAIGPAPVKKPDAAKPAPRAERKPLFASAPKDAEKETKRAE